jgi:hypothetical protein
MAIRLRFSLSCGTIGNTHESSRAGYAFNETVPDVSAACSTSCAKSTSAPIKPGRLRSKLGCRVLLLVRQKELREARRVDVAEKRCARRQQVRLQKFDVEVVTATRRTVHRCAALEDAVRLAAVVHANNGTFVIQRLSAPVFDVAEEVVNTAIGPEVLVGSVPRRLRE